MGDKTGIEWTDATWNPVTGCTKVSQGCKHCYAERVFPRAYKWQMVVSRGVTKPRQFTDIALHPERLNQPIRWARPRRIFVNSMSDLFHEDIPDSFVVDVFAVMALAPRHTFQVLTKRPERMLAWMTANAHGDSIMGRAWQMLGHLPKYAHEGIMGRQWPLQNVWLGVSCEDQATADERIPLLLQTPAAVRWISAEPLLGPVSLGAYLPGTRIADFNIPPPLQWVVVGGESGPGARPMHPQWARDIRDRCAAAGVPFLFKQWGEWSPQLRSYAHDAMTFPTTMKYHDWATGDRSEWIGKKAAGRELDGRTWDGYPA
jgi:protein gp37